VLERLYSKPQPLREAVEDLLRQVAAAAAAAAAPAGDGDNSDGATPPAPPQPPPPPPNVQLVRPGDTAAYSRHFLERTVVCLSGRAPRLSARTRLSQRADLDEILAQAIDHLVRTREHNVLRNGFAARGSAAASSAAGAPRFDNAAAVRLRAYHAARALPAASPPPALPPPQSGRGAFCPRMHHAAGLAGGGAAAAALPSTATATPTTAAAATPTAEALRSSEWRQLHARVGDELMLHLLLHAAIFAPLPNGCYLQLAGRCINDVAWADARFAGGGIPGRARAAALRQRRQQEAAGAAAAAARSEAHPEAWLWESVEGGRAAREVLRVRQRRMERAERRRKQRLRRKRRRRKEREAAAAAAAGEEAAAAAATTVARPPKKDGAALEATPVSRPPRWVRKRRRTAEEVAEEAELATKKRTQAEPPPPPPLPDLPPPARRAVLLADAVDDPDRVPVTQEPVDERQVPPDLWDLGPWEPAVRKAAADRAAAAEAAAAAAAPPPDCIPATLPQPASGPEADLGGPLPPLLTKVQRQRAARRDARRQQQQQGRRRPPSGAAPRGWAPAFRSPLDVTLPRASVFYSATFHPRLRLPSGALLERLVRTTRHSNSSSSSSSLVLPAWLRRPGDGPQQQQQQHQQRRRRPATPAQAARVLHALVFDPRQAAAYAPFDPKKGSYLGGPKAGGGAATASAAAASLAAAPLPSPRRRRYSSADRRILAQLSSMVRRLRRTRSLFGLLRAHCPLPSALGGGGGVAGGNDDQPCFVPHARVASFVWAALLTLVPPAMLGGGGGGGRGAGRGGAQAEQDAGAPRSRPNPRAQPRSRRALRAAVAEFVRLRRFEGMSLDAALRGVRTSEMAWLPLPRRSPATAIPRSLHEKRRRLLALWVWFLFAHVVSPLLRASFYVTEGERGRNAVFYYRKAAWAHLSGRAARELVSGGRYERVSDAQARAALSGRALGPSRLRLVPKGGGDAAAMRPILALGRPCVVRFPARAAAAPAPASARPAAAASAAAAVVPAPAALPAPPPPRLAGRPRTATTATATALATLSRANIAARRPAPPPPLSFPAVNRALEPAVQALRASAGCRPAALLGASAFGYDDALRLLHPFLRRFRAAEARRADQDGATAAGEAASKLLQRRQQQQQQQQPPRAFILTLDVSRAFENLDIARLLERVIDPVVSHDRYLMVRYAAARPYQDGVMSRLQSAAVPLPPAAGAAAAMAAAAPAAPLSSRALARLPPCPPALAGSYAGFERWARAAARDQPSGTVLCEVAAAGGGALYQQQQHPLPPLPPHRVVPGDRLRALLREHVSRNLLRVRGRWYVQRRGIAQGGAASTLLCSLYLADVEREHLLPCLPKGGVGGGGGGRAAGAVAGAAAAVDPPPPQRAAAPLAPCIRKLQHRRLQPHQPPLERHRQRQARAGVTAPLRAAPLGPLLAAAAAAGGTAAAATRGSGGFLTAMAAAAVTPAVDASGGSDAVPQRVPYDRAGAGGDESGGGGGSARACKRPRLAAEPTPTLTPTLPPLAQLGSGSSAPRPPPAAAAGAATTALLLGTASQPSLGEWGAGLPPPPPSTAGGGSGGSGGGVVATATATGGPPVATPWSHLAQLPPASLQQRTPALLLAFGATGEAPGGAAWTGELPGHGGIVGGGSAAGLGGGASLPVAASLPTQVTQAELLEPTQVVPCELDDVEPPEEEDDGGWMDVCGVDDRSGAGGGSLPAPTQVVAEAAAQLTPQPTSAAADTAAGPAPRPQPPPSLPRAPLFVRELPPALRPGRKGRAGAVGVGVRLAQKTMRARDQQKQQQRARLRRPKRQAQQQKATAAEAGGQPPQPQPQQPQRPPQQPPPLTTTATAPFSAAVRFVDDFLFVTTSRAAAEAVAARMLRGFPEAGVHVNPAKTMCNFECTVLPGGSGGDNDPSSSASPALPRSVWKAPDGREYVKWCGLLIDAETLEVCADYTRYAGRHVTSALSLPGGKPGGKRAPARDLLARALRYVRPKCHALLLDTGAVCSPDVARLNVYQSFVLAAIKLHWAARKLLFVAGREGAVELGQRRRPRSKKTDGDAGADADDEGEGGGGAPRSSSRTSSSLASSTTCPRARVLLSVVQACVACTAGMVRGRVRSARRRLGLDVRCCVTRAEVRWLGLAAFRAVLMRKAGGCAARAEAVRALGAALDSPAMRALVPAMAGVVVPERSAVLFDGVKW
jgi:hypothetical protein